MDMMDLGSKRSDECCGVSPSISNKNRIDYPSLNLDDKIPAGLEKKEVGDIVDCHIQIKVRCIEANERIEAGKPKKTFSMAFDVVKIGVMDSKSSLVKKMAGLKNGEY
ncbi:MAG: hypothetical protein ABIA66_00785 [Candidatus Omnitrophota bacterium]